MWFSSREILCFVGGFFIFEAGLCSRAKIEAEEWKGESEVLSTKIQGISSAVEETQSDEYLIRGLYALTLKWCGAFGKCVARVDYYTE